MPTGYTCKVQDGTITTLREFALSCARAFGANILMRDDPQDAPIKEYEPSDYHRKEIETAKAKLYDAERMTLAEAGAAAQRKADEQREALAESARNREQTSKRYVAMLNAVSEWKPPTSEHVELKNFMIRQLRESIDFDCGDMSGYYNTAVVPAAQFKANAIDKARRDIEYHTREWDDEVKRTKERNEWNRALFASLPVVK